MKDKKNTTLAPIICRLVNNEDKYPTHCIMFGLIDVLLAKEEPMVIQYFLKLGYFTNEQYLLFSKRILDKRNKEIQANQTHFIIFYAILHLTLQLYESKQMAVLLGNQLKPENIHVFEENCKVYTFFCKAALSELKKEYQNNYAITVALGKIEGFKFPK